MARDAPRPILITIIAILEFLIGLLILVGGVLLIAGVISAGDVDPEFADLGNAASIAMIVIGLLNIIIAGGFWNGWSIMWYIGLIVNGIGLIVAIYGLITTGIGSAIPLVIYAVILFYLFRPGVKDFFGI
ncbi:MAG: hypothetical protein J6U12_04635 [Candidatus Methanomethylophilaceae archaeon]|nr:hypothetical protein [Candidatus Methanomethylophilaceae archaeon]MBP5684921.1 hypothetical protein [Candidatus Methanomethylophilaceae archaeon]MBP5734560.1 hypothetical protein [Candidatus Methanomethylophilaceae archaeon]